MSTFFCQKGDLKRKEFGPLTFGSTLESYRLGEEMSQKDFARQLGITPLSLCDLEKGRRILSIERAAKIAIKLREPVETWITLALSDMMREADLDLKRDRVFAYLFGLRTIRRNIRNSMSNSQSVGLTLSS